MAGLAMQAEGDGNTRPFFTRPRLSELPVGQEPTYEGDCWGHLVRTPLMRAARQLRAPGKEGRSMQWETPRAAKRPHAPESIKG